MNGDEATHPSVPIKPEARLVKRRIEGCRVTIWKMLMKFAVKPIIIALLEPRRSQIRPAGNATKPVAMAPAVKMLPMKSG